MKTKKKIIIVLFYHTTVCYCVGSMEYTVEFLKSQLYNKEITFLLNGPDHEKKPSLQEGCDEGNCVFSKTMTISCVVML